MHPVYSAGIRTHDLLDMSLLPLPLDQGSRIFNADCGHVKQDVFCSEECLDEAMSSYHPIEAPMAHILSEEQAVR